ncbi:hypothetical protein F5884DRAFT_904142 [Xylogone sp. PMI_703]|nr:hypothetical protein F5884DRAFT_904142 [Xylogone sp. PMI_703]
MPFSISKAVAVVAVGLPLVRAIDNIQFPSVVTAGKPTTLTINGSPSSDDTAYRVSLIITPPGGPESSDTNAVCWLVNSTSIDTTTLSVTIPADVGPSGEYYALAVTALTADGDSDFRYTDGGFKLEGGKATFSPAELMNTAGTSFGNDAVIPCTSYNCVRDCVRDVDFESFANMSDQEIEAETKKAYECMAACPNIDVPSWEDSYGPEAFDDEPSSDDSSSSSAPASSATPSVSSTPTAAVSKASAAVTSTLSTSTSTSTPTSGPSNSTVPVENPNAASHIAAGIPVLLSFAAGILLM